MCSNCPSPKAKIFKPRKLFSAMEEKFFPQCGCFICGKEIYNLRGVVVCADYVDYLSQLVEKRNSAEELVWDSAHKQFVHAVTREYLIQFADLFEEEKKQGGAIVGHLGDAIQKMIDESSDSAQKIYRRLQKVLEKKPSQYLALLVDDGCYGSFEKELLIYAFELERINAPAKALEWTIHLAEKKWFNPLGWINVVERMFGRPVDEYVYEARKTPSGDVN